MLAARHVDDAAPVLGVAGVTKTYRMGEVQVSALRGIDLSLGPGELN
jgi:putative ABC transport system ATP-binding protein